MGPPKHHRQYLQFYQQTAIIRVFAGGLPYAGKTFPIAGQQH